MSYKLGIGNLHIKPPLGLMPEWLYKEKYSDRTPEENEARIDEIGCAIMRYERYGKPIPNEWWVELERRCQHL